VIVLDDVEAVASNDTVVLTAGVSGEKVNDAIVT
jgi:hypothetical protein